MWVQEMCNRTVSHVSCLEEWFNENKIIRTSTENEFFMDEEDLTVLVLTYPQLLNGRFEELKWIGD